MRSFWSEPFLWIHLAGLAVFPLTLELTWLGLGIGEPSAFFWLELLVIAIGGILQPLLMQLYRPFYIFSVLLFSLKPEVLTTRQKQILQQLKSPRQKFFSLMAAILMAFVLWQLYSLAPMANTVTEFLPQSRILGIAIATFSFWLSNIFLQIPLSILGLLWLTDEKLEATELESQMNIQEQFTIPGWQVKQIIGLSNLSKLTNLAAEETSSN